MKFAAILALATGALAADPFTTNKYEDTLVERRQLDECKEVLTVQQGPFAYMDSSEYSYTGAGYGTVKGRGQLIRYTDGSTTGSISLTFANDGAQSPLGQTFNSHLHRGTCESGGGQHYQDLYQCPYGPSATSSCGCANSCTEFNSPGQEMWFTGTVDSTSGRLVEETTATWFIPEHVEFFDGCEQDIGDLSIVIHDTPAASSGSGAKMLCVDLEIEDQTKGVKGYANIPTGEDDEPKLKKMTMTRTEEGSTEIKVNWQKLRDEFTYPSHVHAEPCTVVDNGGPHYVRDIACVNNEGGSGCPATAETEFWSGPFTTNRRGKFSGTFEIPVIARAGAQSVVLHDCLDANCEPDDTGACPGGTDSSGVACSGKPRIYCADLVNK
mmetsp:Transcript_7023/g.22169  ORF Transcript_7023/g.22169 Transcript_7023/m.22169 type:complete len:382 (+) Transcript_7023:84-1229(+)